MAGEIIKADTLEEAENQIISIYKQKSIEFEFITKPDYFKIQKQERPDSDNHLNPERLGTDTKFVDFAFYKYLPERWEAWRIELIDETLKPQKTLFFKILPRLDV
jgi:spore coat polysaccharide biosynthesis protein SpsF (cytidylyltransferase family)